MIGGYSKGILRVGTIQRDAQPLHTAQSFPRSAFPSPRSGDFEFAVTTGAMVVRVSIHELRCGVLADDSSSRSNDMHLGGARTRMSKPQTTTSPQMQDAMSGPAAPVMVTSDSCQWFLVRRSASGDDQHRTFIAVSPFTVGRRPGSGMCLADPTVSGQHAELRVEGADLFVTDVGSTNGTLVNGVPVSASQRLNDGDIVHFGQKVFSVERKVLNAWSSSDVRNKTHATTVPEDAVLYERFDQLLNQPDIDPYFQPIVAYKDGATVGYEVLVRSRVKGLEFPDSIFRIAALRMAEARLSEVCRSEGLLSGIQLDPNGTYFLNTHASELETPRLLESLQELRRDYPNMSVVLEIHESAITSVEYLTELSAVLKDLNFGLAYDDFGSGQARLVELFEVPPRYLKFDMSIIRGLQTASAPHLASVRALINMVHDLDVIALAEGVETPTESSICEDLGFDMAQGYLFGRPHPREYWLRQVASAPTQQFFTPAPEQFSC